MEDSRMDAVPSAPPLGPGDGRADHWASWEETLSWEEPTERALPLLMLTPVPGPRAPRGPWPGTAGAVVTGIAVLVITAELGRRAGAPARLTAVCSAGACAVVVVPRLVPRLPATASLPRHRFRPAFAGAAP
ncbi:hypothetical protein ACQPZP_12410 [Spirillospora sp. CA-142024]|uniref:hypothetical protein n=1 Tax=Spirillospora sp. CA-142024 TaxID=3240036 RepID=UPI003D8D6AEB